MNVAGTGATSGRLLVSLTTASPPGARSVSTYFERRQLTAGHRRWVTANDESATARFVSGAIELLLLSGSGTLLDETVAW